MFERFTDRARRVVVLAQEEARGLNHAYIGTEHLVLGLLAEGEGVGGKVLEDLGADLATVRAEVVGLVGRGATEPDPGHIPFTPRAKQALELAFRESLQLGHNYIGTEHVLLGLLREGEGIGSQLIVRVGGSLDDVRSRVIQRLVGYAAATAQPVSPPPLAQHGWSPALVSALDLAATRAGAGSTVGTHHVLSVFADWDDVAANQILRAGGFDRSRLEQEMEEWDVAGTRDETEEAWSLRVTEVEADDEALTFRILDAELRERILAALAEDDAAVRAAFGKAVREIQRGLPPTST